jgi:hypothetical protein
MCFRSSIWTQWNPLNPKTLTCKRIARTNKATGRIVLSPYRVGRNLALYQARGAQQDWFFRGLPFRNKLDGGKPSMIWGPKFETGLSAVSPYPCGPLALIPINGKKKKSGATFGLKNDCSARPWGRRAVTFVSESCILVDNRGHLASVLRDSAVYSRN